MPDFTIRKGKVLLFRRFTNHILLTPLISQWAVAINLNGGMLIKAKVTGPTGDRVVETHSQGEFDVQNLIPGSYKLMLRDWYVEHSIDRFSRWKRGGN